MNFLVGVIIGGVIVLLFIIFIKKNKEIVQLKSAKKKVVAENLILTNENVQSEVTINKFAERLENLELRMDQAEIWFGSVIRHSREQFSKEAVEKFLEEHGMNENNE